MSRIREGSEDSDCGLTVDPHRPAALAEAMVVLSDDRSRRDRTARNACRLTRGTFATERIADLRFGAVAESHQPRARPARR